MSDLKRAYEAAREVTFRGDGAVDAFLAVLGIDPNDLVKRRRFNGWFDLEQWVFDHHFEDNGLNRIWLLVPVKGDTE